MDVHLIEEKLGLIGDQRYVDIITQLIAAVTDFPEYDLSDLDLYLERVKSMIGSDVISYASIKHLSEERLKAINEDTGWWVLESLSGLLNALDLMELYSIKFDDVLACIRKLE